MLKARMLLSAIAVGVTIPAAAHAQIPQVPEAPQVLQVPEAPQIPQVPEVPEVPVPDLPDLGPVPEPPLVPAPELPAPPVPASSGGDGGSPSGGSAPAPTASGGGGGVSSGGGGSTSADGGSGTATTRSRATRDTRAPAQRRRAERRLRHAVARLGGCLDELSYGQRRVLQLRAGVGAGPPRSRRGVARTLDIRVDRVRKLERRGLRNARALARADGCGSASAGGGTIALSSRPDGGGPIVTEASAGPASNGAEERGTEPDGGVPDSGGVLGESSALAPPDLGGGARRGESATGTSLWVAVGLMLLAALAGFATPTLSARVRESGTTSAG
jgi:hypothetical protein